MGIHLGRVGHIGIHVSDVDRSIDFYRRVLGLKLTGRWGPPDIGRPICFMRIDDKHHDVVLFELPEDARRAGVAVTDSSLGRAPGLDHIAFEVDSREDWLLALDHLRSCGVEIVSGPYVHAPEGREGLRRRERQPRLLLPRPGRQPDRGLLLDDESDGPSMAAPHPDL
jgi:catechol 2,3-dioxygenase-like lactoylglutathione lyase family enzyme